MKFVLTAALAASALSVPAFAQQTPAPGHSYYEINLGSGLGGAAHVSASATGQGSVSGDINLKAGFFGSGALGYSFGNGLAAEFEGLYLRNGIDNPSGDITAETYGAMGNVMYAIGEVGPLVPYIGGGVGYGAAKYTVAGSDAQGSGFMWQARAGVSGKLAGTMKWDLGYRYLQSPDYNVSAASASALGETINGSAKIATHTHIISVGFRQSF